MAGFFTMFWRLNFNVMGMVTGGDFKNGKLPFAYLGKGKKENKGKLMIYGEKLEDYCFDKSNIESIVVRGSGITFKFLSNKTYIGTQYEIKFKDGKTAIISIPQNDTPRFERYVY